MTTPTLVAAPVVFRPSKVVNEELSSRFPDGSALLTMMDGSLILVEAVAPYQVEGDADAL